MLCEVYAIPRLGVRFVLSSVLVSVFFFFQAEDGIRDLTVTGVQTCALPILWATMGPPVRFRIKTIARFLPSGVAAPELLVQEFDRLQAAQLDCLAQADGLPLSQVRVTSPFNARVRYNLYACFTILPRHQHRHLWQAERVWEPRLLSGAR